jgi:hypothetical protein
MIVRFTPRETVTEKPQYEGEEYSMDEIDHALSSLGQLHSCRKQLKECTDDAWREYWEKSCEFWIQSIGEWLRQAKDNQ